MGERMTLKKFDRHGAILDEIRATIKLCEELLHGEGEKGEETMASTRHDFFKKRLNELGLYDKDSDYYGMIGQAVEELSGIFARQGHSGMSEQITMEVFNKLMAEYSGDTEHDQPSPTPSRQEWLEWIDKMPYLQVFDSWSRDNWQAWFRTMPIVPKG